MTLGIAKPTMRIYATKDEPSGSVHAGAQLMIKMKNIMKPSIYGVIIICLLKEIHKCTCEIGMLP